MSLAPGEEVFREGRAEVRLSEGTIKGGILSENITTAALREKVQLSLSPCDKLPAGGWNRGRVDACSSQLA